MSSVFDVLKEAEDEVDVKRWVTIVEQDPAIKEPEFKMEISFLPTDEFERITREFKKRMDFGMLILGNLVPSQQTKLKKLVMKRVVKDWVGCTRGNMRRVSDLALLRPSALAQLPDVIECTPDNIEGLAEVIEMTTFSAIQTAATDLEGVATETAGKND